MKILVLERCGLMYGSAFNMLQWARHFIDSDLASVDMVLAEPGDFAVQAEESGVSTQIWGLPNKLNSYGKQNLKWLSALITLPLLIWFNFKCIRNYAKQNEPYQLVVCNNYRSYIYFFGLLVYLRYYKKKRCILRLQVSHTPINLMAKLAPKLFSNIIIHGTPGYAKTHVNPSIALAQNSLCLPNPVDTNAYRPIPERRARLREQLEISANDYVFICVASIEPRKKVLELVQEFVRSAPSNALLVHVGGNDAHPKYQQQLELAVSSRVRLLGQRNDVVDLLQVADAFVLFSEYEGMPYAIVEAMACALPVLATNVGSNCEVLQGVGKVIEVNNQQQLAQGMIEFVSQPELHRDQGLQARNKVIQEYSCEEYLKRVEAIYCQGA
ncbi:glycosyltransferase [Alginatibacterium sediminis]|uniref:Glycosyltransferase n=1 Tax=Alginatibacterium sediminis TaxID=2164068 RepID=A0A420E6W5_9ALTE|nr:glycosyltransferase [Alginatibacterium sediminis]RKF13225.1 glycosyltransferase [Alginatibacterium sediminis]